MTAAGPFDGLAWIAMGTLAIVFRRRLAEGKRLPWGRAADEVFGVDVRIFAPILVGVVAIVMGLAAFLVWAMA